MQNGNMLQQWGLSQLSAENAAYVEDLYEQYLLSPQSVPDDWRAYFEKLPRVNGLEQDMPHKNVREQFLLLGRNSSRVQPMQVSSVSTEHEKRQVGVLQLIAAYRNRGHQKAKLDPLGLMQREAVPDLELSAHGLSRSDFNTVFQTGNLAINKTEATLGEMVEAMEATYCGSIGTEYMHIVDTAEKRWIQQRLESVRGNPKFTTETRKHILERLTAAEGLEKFLGNKYVGAKRFGQRLIATVEGVHFRHSGCGTCAVEFSNELVEAGPLNSTLGSRLRSNGGDRRSRNGRTRCLA